MKKHLRRILSLALALVFCTLSVIGASALNQDTPAYKAKLKFGSDGKFTILQISDIQESFVLSPITRDLILASMEKVDEDLIVLTGDNFGGGSCRTGMKFLDRILVRMAINNYMSIFEKAGTPVAVVFGNHDAENAISKEEQFEMYSKYSCFIGFDEGADIYGCGNYNVPIFPSAGGTVPAFNLWMFDSGMYDGDNGYDYMRPSQINWYVNTSNELKAQNGGAVIPSMAFQHIIVPEIYDALLVVPEGTPGAIRTGSEPDYIYYTLNPANTKKGVLAEAPCPSATNAGQFTAMKNQGDVVAMFFGHDHVNTFEVAYQGIDLVNSPGITFGSYGSEVRGCREIVISETDPRNYETKPYSYRDFYGDDELAWVRYKAFNNGSTDWEKFSSAIEYFFRAYVFTLFGLLK